MMLRASSLATQRDLKIEAVTTGVASASGIEHGEVLVAFTEAVVSQDEQRMAPLRQRIRREMGNRQLVDVSGVIANFHRMTRVADGTGIPLDDRVMGLTEDLRGALGINAYRSAANTFND